MARQTLPKTIAPGKYATTGQEITFTAGDAVNGNQFVSTGRELLIARNTDVANPYYVTVTSAPDAYGRLGNINQVDVPAGKFAVFGPFPVAGWRQPDGMIYVNVENAAIELAVVQLPD